MKIKEILNHTNAAGEVYLCDVRKAMPNSTVQQAREVVNFLTEIQKEMEGKRPQRSTEALR